LAERDYAELVKSDRVREMVEEHVQRLNSQLNRWETIKKWAILDRDLSIESGELTPSLKVKRSVVADENKKLLDSFYS
jgi:long-chain acyl-CoA synthetase